MIELAQSFFSHICHQEPGRSWVMGGVTLPLCARCAGVYAGAFLAVLALPAARFAPTRRVLWLHGAAILQMAFFGFHLVGEQPAWVRTLSGTLFAFGVAYFLWQPVRGALWPSGRGGRRGYFTAAAAAIAAIEIAVHINSRAMAVAITASALAGAAVLTLLAVASVVFVSTEWGQLVLHRRP